MALLLDQTFRIFYSPADDPLNNFYIPALSASVRYDRTAGYFNSSALAIAAKGVARLIQNGGWMRLLVGADLDSDDVEAIRQGEDLRERLTMRMLERFTDPLDALMKQRLEVLAWMVAEGTLEIRVVLPTDKDGLPIPASDSRDYYHSKTGIFTDSEDNQVGFTGSVNESAQGWEHNYETFMVYESWDNGLPYLRQVAINFEKLWDGREKDWIAVDIPQAVIEKLLLLKPKEAPTRDPLEPEPAPPALQKVTEPDHQKERLLFQYLRDAPFLLNADGLGMATSAISAWPHQSRVAKEVLEKFPDTAMLCDEVGLGKTIEAGLVIRQLIISGRVKRCLILVPKSVLKQWQEELYEKFALEVPRYDGSKFLDRHDQAIAAATGNPWDAFPLMLAGSQLAKRSDRRDQILTAQGWDLVVVDEAHHARRKDFKERVYRPNRLLGLLSEINERGKAGSLLLMTATPMQVHPLEVWDLLRLLGLGGLWGADEDNFLYFFSEMRKPFADIDWDGVFDLVQDYLNTGGQPDLAFMNQAKGEIGAVKWATLEELPRKKSGRNQAIKQLGTKAQPYVKEYARRHTPLRRFVFRNTRSLLREYQRLGVLKDNVPTRKPHIVRVPMREDEFTLYQRIEEYINQFYQKYEQERRGLGFVMTVYRRRLTSSFFAVRCSLERRLKFLRGEAEFDKVYDDDDTEQEELSLDISEEVQDNSDHKRFLAELHYVRDFLNELKTLSMADSKLEHLIGELSQVFKQRSKVMIFTQYTDTMDYLRDQLAEVYGSQVACYSGRGGEVWNPVLRTWVPMAKETVKNEFRKGELRILLCTDSASEGLNLQTCGVLINYDMPWNPMRVEQRIGRIDRIGQEFKEVWISNYFYQDTIEDTIYQRLSDRINWFEVVVGDLQPILAEVGEMTRRLAMLPSEKREAQLEAEIDALKERLQNRELESLNLDDFALTEKLVAFPPSPVSLPELEKLLTESALTGKLFQHHPTIPGGYLLDWEGRSIPVTFLPDCFDRNSDTVQFLSYGNSLLEKLLDSASLPEVDHRLVRMCTDRDGLLVRAWYNQAGEPIENVAELQKWLELATDIPIEANTVSQIESKFGHSVNEVRARIEKIIKFRKESVYQRERINAQRLLIKAALVEIALGQNPTLWEKDHYPSAFMIQAVRGLQRHKYPWSALLQLAFSSDLVVTEQDPFYQQIKDSSVESLKGRFSQLAEEAKRVVPTLKAYKPK